MQQHQRVSRGEAIRGAPLFPEMAVASGRAARSRQFRAPCPTPPSHRARSLGRGRPPRRRDAARDMIAELMGPWETWFQRLTDDLAVSAGRPLHPVEVDELELYVASVAIELLRSRVSR